MSPRPQAGFTLTELAIVMALAALVTVGLVTFYLNSQGMWVDASTQSMIQRDATLIVERMAQRTHVAYTAEVLNYPDSLHQTVILFARDLEETSRFWWSQSDSLIHYSVGASGADLGSIVGSKVERFTIDRDSTHVYLRDLKMLTTAGTPVQMTSTMRLYNR
jgi:prepilin-type N-terminal cleavage/methylation domain-containing protein